MPTLNWIGKEAVVNHHNEVPFHLLKDVPALACGEPGDGNLIVQGDNLVALLMKQWSALISAMKYGLAIKVMLFPNAKLFSVRLFLILFLVVGQLDMLY